MFENLAFIAGGRTRSYVFGVSIILFGGLLLWKRGPLRWLDEQTNGRWARFGARFGAKNAVANQRRATELVVVLVPLVIIVIGLTFLIEP